MPDDQEPPVLSYSHQASEPPKPAKRAEMGLLIGSVLTMCLPPVSLLLAVLSIILTATPGTAWIEYSHDRQTLVLHVFDGAETDHYLHVIRDVYEPMLQEIFE